MGRKSPPREPYRWDPLLDGSRTPAQPPRSAQRQRRLGRMAAHPHWTWRWVGAWEPVGARAPAELAPAPRVDPAARLPWLLWTGSPAAEREGWHGELPLLRVQGPRAWPRRRPPKARAPGLVPAPALSLLLSAARTRELLPELSAPAWVQPVASVAERRADRRDP